jgi:hypothetical protein
MTNEANKHTRNEQTRQSGIYVNLSLIKLDRNNTKIHPKAYNYIKSLILTHPEPEVIRITKAIGVNHFDKIVCLTNLFFICVRQDKTSLMQRIIESVSQIEKVFMVNANDREYTPIMHAAYNGSANSIKYLIHWGADINIVNKDGENVFSAADAGLKDEIVKFPSLELFLRPKFQEIKNHLEWCKTNTEDFNFDDSSTNSTVSQMKSSDETVSTLINPKENIQEQFVDILRSCIDDCRSSTMIKLFNEVNKLVTDKLIDKKIVIDTLVEFRDILAEEYEDEFSTLVL